MSTIFRIDKALNGFCVEVCVPLKKSESKDVCYQGNSYSEVLAKDATELADTISTLLPLLDTEYKNDDEFEKAFNEATKNK